MNIAINAFSVQQGGGLSILENLLPQLARVDQKNIYVIFYSPRQTSTVQGFSDDFKKIPIRFVPRNPYLRVLWEQCIFPWYLYWHKIDLLYSLGNITTIAAPCRIVLLIENMNPYSRIDLRWSLLERIRLRFLGILGRLSAWRATMIRFVSENSKTVIIPQLYVFPHKCFVIPHGVSMRMLSETFDNAAPPHNRNYLLTIGVNAVHRNTHGLLKAFSILVKEYGYSGDLLVVGVRRSQWYRTLLDMLVKELQLEKCVRFVGEVPHHLILGYYQFADAVCAPSIEEAFGTPLIEAMALGVPIVASDCDLDEQYRGRCFNPFRENCAGAASYFNPFNEEDIARTIHEVLSNKQLRDEHIRIGKERAKDFSIEKIAYALVELFNKAALDAVNN